MSAYLTARISPALLAVVCVLALLIAACAPAATPTPTSAPTSTPVEEETEPTEAVVEEEPTNAAEEEAEPTEALAEEEATEAADATEMAEAGEAEATEAAGADATEAASAEADAGEAASGEGMPGVVGVTSTRVRETPAVRGTVIIEIPLGTEVVALGQTANEGYLFIRLEDGTEGWVSKQTINLEDRFAALPIIEPES